MSAAVECPSCQQELLPSAIRGQYYCPDGHGWLDGEKFTKTDSNGSAPEAAERPPGESDLPRPGEVLDEVVGFVRRFVCMTESEAVATALWIFHTHTLAASQATPYIAITSAEKESGKTLLLEVLNLLVANPWLTGRATAAVLPRKIDVDRPTLLLDESDTAFKGDRDYAEALRGVFNTGYRRSGKTTVCVGQGVEIGFKDFSTFCPKAIAGIGKLPDTVQSRSIPIRLKRKAPGETVERFRERDVTDQARPLRDALELVALSLVTELAPARPDLPDELGDRAQDVWEPLLAIADAAAGDWPEQARLSAKQLSANGNAETAPPASSCSPTSGPCSPRGTPIGFPRRSCSTRAASYQRALGSSGTASRSRPVDSPGC